MIQPHRIHVRARQPAMMLGVGVFMVAFGGWWAASPPVLVTLPFQNPTINRTIGALGLVVGLYLVADGLWLLMNRLRGIPTVLMDDEGCTLRTGFPMIRIRWLDVTAAYVEGHHVVLTGPHKAYYLHPSTYEGSHTPEDLAELAGSYLRQQ